MLPESRKGDVRRTTCVTTCYYAEASHFLHAFSPIYDSSGSRTLAFSEKTALLLHGNRMYQRILASLDAKDARRYSQVDASTAPLNERIKAAASAENGKLVAELIAKPDKSRKVESAG